MASYSDRLRLTLQVTGENPDTWGDVANSGVFQLLEDAIAKMASVSVAGGNVTLSTANGAADEGRCAIIKVTGAIGVNRTVTVPNEEKWYLVWNATTGGYTVTVKTAAGTGVTVTQGKAQWVFCDATEVYNTSVDHADSADSATSATSVPNNTITYAMMQDMTTGRLIGRTTAGSGDPEEISISGSGLTLSGGSLSLNLGNSNAWTKNQYVTPSALSDGANIAVDASLSNTFTVTLGGNRTLDNPTNLANGMVLTFRIKQDATGSRTLAYGTKYEFPGDVAPTLTTTANKMDVITCTYDSAADKLYCTISQNYSTS